MSLRGNGFECPAPLEGVPGLDEADRAGETDPPRVERLLDLVVLPDVLGLELSADGLTPIPGCTLMTPAAMPPDTGTNTAGGGGTDAEEDVTCGDG